MDGVGILKVTVVKAAAPDAPLRQAIPLPAPRAPEVPPLAPMDGAEGTLEIRFARPVVPLEVVAVYTGQLLITPSFILVCLGYVNTNAK